MTAPAKQAWKTRPVLRKGLTSRRCQFVREIINEVAGQSVLQKRMRELILTGNSTKEKRAQKIAKQKLGTHRRAIIYKRNLMDTIQAEQRARQEGKK